MRSLLLLLLSLATAPLLADRKPLPPLTDAGAWALTYVATDGTNFLGISVGTGAPAAILFDGAGRVLRGPELLPFDTYIYGVGYAGGRYVVFSASSFVRLAQDGTRVDREPVRLPYALDALGLPQIASNGERLLVRDASGLLFFLDPAGAVTLPPAAVVPDRISSVASDGERFVLVEKDAGTAVRFVILDGSGNFVHTIERPVPKPVARPLLATDGATWGLFDPAAAPHLVLLDLDFNTIGTRWTTGMALESVLGMRGRGYFAVAVRSAGTWDQMWVAIELAAPSYEARSVAQGPWGTFRGAADNGTSLFLDHSDPSTNAAGIFIAPTLAQWQTTPRAALPVRALDRYTKGVARNDAGLSLVVWRGRHPLQSFVSFLGPDGTALDREPIALETTDCTEETSVASNGRGFMIAIRTCNGTLALATFDEHGAPLRPLRIFDLHADDPQVISDGQNYAVIWDGFDYDQQLPAVAGALLDANGLVLFQGLIWSGANHGRIAAAPAGGGYLLVMRAPAYADVRSTLLLDATLAPRRGARPFRMHVAPGGWTEGGMRALIAAPNGYLYASTVSNEANGDRHPAVVWLDADGRSSPSGLGSGGVRFDRTPLLRCEAECTIVTQHQLSGRVQELLQSSIGTDAEGAPVLHTPRPLAHFTGAGRDGARAVGWIPAGLLVERVDPETGSRELFLRAPSRVRSVRH